MRLSTTLLSTISKTKKRLSDPRWEMPCVILGVVGLLHILAMGMRTISLTWDFGMIRAHIPLMLSPLADPSWEASSLTALDRIAKTTPVIVLANDALYFGDLSAFTTAFKQVRNKFKIAHVDGSPQLGLLFNQLKKWQRQRHNQFQIPPSSVAILVPGEQWPVAVIMQMLHHLQQPGLYEKIVLAAGYRS